MKRLGARKVGELFRGDFSHVRRKLAGGVRTAGTRNRAEAGGKAPSGVAETMEEDSPSPTLASPPKRQSPKVAGGGPWTSGV